ncbi:MAG: glycoside hydrolase family 16 protein [Ferruginibacter sp.]|nr:glycoside hydrolase family 16 protein [Cytophagales bacterium]
MAIFSRETPARMISVSRASIAAFLLCWMGLSGALPRLPSSPPTDGYAPSAPAQPWKLVWQDEFDGPRIDTTKWTPEVNDRGGGNEELQYYTARPENAYLKNSTLVIVAQREKYLTKAFTSARLNTRHKADWQYGRFEVRAKMPKGWGLWPAIWMLPTDDRYGPWPAGGEIDIAEVLGREPSEVHGVVHFGSETPRHRRSSAGTTQLKKGDFSGKFHVFSVEWEAREIRWYLDNQLYHTARVIRPLDERYHLLLNLAVGSNWPGTPKANTPFPAYFYVDYVRVFARTETETPSEDGHPTQSGN